MDGVVRHVLIVNLFPNINLTTIRPASAVVLRHHPKSREVTRVAVGEEACFNFSVAHREFAVSLNAAADHVDIIGGLERVGHTASNKLSVFDVASQFMFLLVL